jgi:hypothetical protein
LYRTVSPVVSIKFTVSLEVQITLVITDWEYVAELRANADDARQERADVVAASTVTGELIVNIAHCADEQLLCDKLRCTPIKVEVEAVLILGIGVDVIMGEAGDRRELMSGLLVKVSSIDSVMPKFARLVRSYAPTGMSPVMYVM